MDEEQSSRLKILVVDDEVLNQQIMRLLLEHWGHDVSIAGDGVEAVDCVEATQFDIVFMDLQMPGMGGLEATRKIREKENGGRHTFIVALTASYQPDDGRKMFEAGIDNYIAKPFEVEHLEQILKYRAASSRQVEGAARAMPIGEIVIQDVLDVHRGIEWVGSSPDSYWSLLHDFIAGLPGRMKILQNALALQDFETISREAHNLKGVSANLGALQLSEHANRLDRVSREGYTQETAKLVDETWTAGVELQQVANVLLSGRKTSAGE
jgi:CheY-like chemotaxis protein